MYIYTYVLAFTSIYLYVALPPHGPRPGLVSYLGGQYLSVFCEMEFTTVLFLLRISFRYPISRNKNFLFLQNFVLLIFVELSSLLCSRVVLRIFCL